MDSEIRFRVLGPVEATRRGKAVSLGGPKQRRLLASLLLSAGRVARTDVLIDAMWGDRPPATAVKTIQKYVSTLRKALGAASIATRSGGYVLDVAPEQIDVRRFENLIIEASRTTTPDRAAAALEEALSLWHGVPWTDLIDDDSAGSERARLEELKLSAIEDLMDAELAAGHHSRAVGRLEELVAEHPLRERLWGQLMLALYRSGRQAKALATYRRLRAALADDLGVDPSPELQELERRILEHDPELSSGVPAPVAGDARSVTNLPTPLTRFVGRRRELAEVTRLLINTRLLTLTGVGGCGKTRLALQTGAAMLDEHPDGIWFVVLDSVSDPRLVPRAVATAIGAREQPGISLPQVIADVLRSKRVLLILDNCEHLIDACAHLADMLLGRCSDLRILTTSRERLGVIGEVVWQVPPMPVPQSEGLPVESLIGHEAIELFVDRASAASPGFLLTSDNGEAVAQVCKELDGLPLALELAATRVSSIGVSEIARRLGDRFRVLREGSRTAPPRQQALRAAVDWSYDLLDAAEQRLFNHLSVFNGEFTLEAAEDVCSERGIASAEVMDLLSHLVGKSLVLQVATSGGAVRYRILETLRHYGRDHLRDAGAEDDVRRKHALYFLGLAQEAEPQLRGPQQIEWLDRLETEHGNLRAALEWSRGHGEIGLPLATALWEFWESRAHPSEGLTWLEESLANPGGVEESVRARALLVAGWLALDLAEPERAETRATESLEVYRRLGNESGIALSTHLLGWVAQYRSDYERAAELIESARVRHEDIGERFHAGWALHHLGMLARLRGDYEGAKTLHEEAIAVYREVGDRTRVGFALWNLGVVARYQGDYETAAAWCEDALQVLTEARDASGAAHVGYTLGDVARLQGDYGRAVSLYEDSLARLRELGDKRCVASVLANLGLVAQQRVQAERAADLFVESLTLRKELGDKAGIAECLENLGVVCAGLDEPVRAAELLGAAHVLRDMSGSARPDPEGHEHERRLSDLRTVLGDEAFASAWARGAAAHDNVILDALQITAARVR